jgi:predicted transglutaminase-like cysteine proteinase
MKKALVALAFLLSTIPVVAEPLLSQGPANPTKAWNEFCSRVPAECEVDTREQAVVRDTAGLRKLLERVNREVNDRITPVSDDPNHDVWTFPDQGFGDCEDIQLLKRRLLIEAGLPRRALRMTVVINHIGEGHAVLTVHTHVEDLILDNYTNAVLPWHRTGYVFIKREGRFGPQWEHLGGAMGPPLRTSTTREAS